MRFIIILLLLTINSVAIAQVEVMEKLDQNKLGQLLQNIPAVLKLEERINPLPGLTEVSTHFPKTPGPFAIHCHRKFYNQSLYPSETNCNITVDFNHLELQRGGDEFKILVSDVTLAGTLYKAIPHGKPVKKLYSWGRSVGSSFEGNKTEIFHYRFYCSDKECELRLSNRLF